jgi:hypothetical protein
MRICLNILLLLTGFIAQSQIVTGRVVEGQSNTGLPYVHIGVVNKNIGTISHENGDFTLDVSKLSDQEKITFSMVGYTSVHLPISQLKGDNQIVRLNPSVTTLKEVVVKATPIVELIKLGRPELAKITIGHSGNREWGTGTEWGLRIPTNGHRYKLQEIGFHTRFNTVDSVLFRVNFYGIQDGMPAETILEKDVYVTSHKKDKWIIKDINENQLIVSEDFVVTIEIIRIWYSKNGENQLFFTYGKEKEKLTTYSRASSQDLWVVNEMPPLAFYVVGRKID